MFFKRLQTGVYAVNCYILADEATKEAVVVDPGGDLDDIAAVLQKEELTVRYILLTHGHGDHIGALAELKQLTGAQVGIHGNDADMLADPAKNLSPQTSGRPIAMTADILLEEGQVISFGSCSVTVIHTPGHTRGGVCFQAEDFVITGDTLFRASVGRSDLHGGNHDQLVKSIKTKLLSLPGETEVYPGHGAGSTIAYEKKANPYVR